MQKKPHSIVSAGVVALYSDLLGRRLATEVLPDFEYPDGSLHYSDDDTCESLRMEIGTSGIGRYVATSVGRSCPVYSPLFDYKILYTASYQKLLGEEGFFGGSPRTPTAEDERRNPIEIVVEFKRTLKRRFYEGYAEQIAQWKRECNSVLIAGEGPIRFALPDIHFSQKWAWFVLDSTQAGPYSLLYLILAHLRLGVSLQPVFSIYVNPAASWNPRLVRPLDPVRIMIPNDDTLATFAKPLLLATMPSAPIRHRWGYIGQFGMETPYPVEFSETLDWEQWTCSIFFKASLSNNEVKLVQELLQAWRILLTHGAFLGTAYWDDDAIDISSDARSVNVAGSFREVHLEDAMVALFRILNEIHGAAPISNVSVG